jgi:hypothetical protein
MSFANFLFPRVLFSGMFLLTQCFSASAANDIIFKPDDSFCPFFWTLASGESSPKGFYGFAKVIDQFANKSLTITSARFRMEKASWWQKIVMNIDTTISIVVADKKPDSVYTCSGKFDPVHWLCSIQGGTDTARYFFRFIFPILPQNQSYGPYDYYTIRFNDTMDIQFQDLNDSVLIGSFINIATPRKATTIFAKNAIVIQTTFSNPLRIKSIQVDSANEKLVSSYLNFDLLSLHQKAKTYGLNFIDTTIVPQIVQISSVSISGKTELIADSTYQVTWSMSNADNVARCSLYISLDAGTSWRPAGMTSGAATTLQWTAMPQVSQHCLIKILASDKNGYKYSGLSPEFAIISASNTIKPDKIPPVNDYSLRGDTLDSKIVRLAWSPKQQANTAIDSIAIRCDSLHFPTSMNDSNSRLIHVFSTADSCDTIRNLFPNQSYYFSLFVTNASGLWSAASQGAMLLLRINKSAGNVISLGTDTVRVFNDSLKLWTQPKLLVSYFDTLDSWSGPTIKPGFIQISPGFSLRQGATPPNTKLGIVITYYNFPAAASTKDKKIYQFNIFTGKWRLNSDMVKIDTSAHTMQTTLDNARFPFMAMIDTSAPTLFRQSGGRTYSISQQISDTCTISDNIENLNIRLLAGAGNSDLADYSAYITPLSDVSSYRISIPPFIADQCSGLRSFLIADDGRNKSQINLSEKINRTDANCDDIIIPASQWTPIFVTALPEKNTIDSAIVSASGYNKKTSRILQWIPGPNNASSKEKWVEYGDERGPNLLKLGQLIWMKSLSDKAIKFSNAVVPALIDTVAVPLNSSGWTDFSIPFRYNFYIGDILNTTQKSTIAPIDSIGIYQWVKSGPSYVTQPVFLKGITAVGDSLDTLIGGNPYSLYNPLSDSISLRIPPEGMAFSSHNLHETLLKKANNPSWSVKVGIRYNDSLQLAPIYCASLPASKIPAWYPVSPSFALIKTGIKNQSNNLIYGNTASGDLTPGGCMFELSCENLADITNSVTLFIDKANRIPFGSKTGLFSIDCQSSGLHDSLRLALNSIEKKSYYLIIGNDTYIQKISKLIASKLTLRIAGLGRAMRVAFTVPLGTQSMEFTMYDARGRIVWKRKNPISAAVAEGFFQISRPVAAGFVLIELKVKVSGENTDRIIRQKALYVR